MAHLWIPLPDLDFDVTEVAVPWKVLTRAGHRGTDTDDAYLFAKRFLSRLPAGVAS